MKPIDLLSSRLIHQQLQLPSFKHPHEIVDYMGAIQAQEFASSQWAIGCRLPNSTLPDIQTALKNKTIVRVSALRGTLHLVTAANIRWLLQIVRPAVQSKFNSMRRKLGMDEKMLSKTNDLIQKALSGGQHLSRTALLEYLQQHKINTEENRMNHILYEAAVSGLICNSPEKGSYTLLEEWLPPVPEISRAEALGLLAKKYFQSHGPATQADFAAWSGLSMTEASTAVAAVKASFTLSVIDGTEYLMKKIKLKQEPSTFLLPAFDEYFLGYKNRAQLADAADIPKIMTKNGIFNPLMVLDGKITGTWKRVLKSGIEMNLMPFRPMKKKELARFEEAAEQYAGFVQLPILKFNVK